MQRAVRLAASLAAALLPGAAAASDFDPSSLRTGFAEDRPYFTGSALAAGELGKLRDAADFVGSVAALDPDRQFSPFPGALGRASAAFRGRLWGVGMAFDGEAVGRRTPDLFEGRIESLLAADAWREEQLTERVHVAVDATFFTGARFSYRFAPSILETGERWRTGGQLLAGVRHDFTDRVRIWIRPGVRYQVLDLGDRESPGWHASGRVDLAWDAEIVLPPRWPLWISFRGWAADDFTGTFAGARVDVRFSRRLQLAVEADSRWDELSLSYWPFRMIEATALLHRDREFGTVLVGIGGRLYFGGLSVPPFFSR